MSHMRLLDALHVAAETHETFPVFSSMFVSRKGAR